MRVAGIPALVRVTGYTPFVSARTYGVHPDWAQPGCGGDLDYEICDGRGRPAPWLARKLDAHARRDLECELLEALHAPEEVEPW